MQVYLPSKIAPNPDVLFQPLNGESILLNLHTEQYYSLDDVGTCMWELFKTYECVDIIIEHLLDKYNVEEDCLRSDLAGLIEKLIEAKLITTIEA